ncbi:MAG: histidine kinase [Leptolyngbya sp. ERB_1_1]
MVTSVNLSSSLSDPSYSINSPVTSDSTTIADIAELMMTQDAAGVLLGFHWREISEDESRPWIGKPLGTGFTPVSCAPYLARLKRVLASQTPEQFRCLFEWGDHTILFDLVMSPVILPNGTAAIVVVTGEQANELDEARSPLQAVELSREENLDHYQQLLTQIVWNARQNLELPTIWQATVDGLGLALDVSRCVICPYDPGRASIQAVAEFRQDCLSSLKGEVLQLQDEPLLQKALSTLKPVRAVRQAPEEINPAPEADIPQTRLLVATHYQNHPNGMIILDQCDRDRVWTQAELEFVQELADQVGTSIAHAALLIELQRANDKLMLKHRELEEARHQAEEASRLKSEFLANTSHELRTPLNGMIGFLKLVLDGMAEDPQEQREFIEEAHRSAMHLLDIINDVLDIAKIEAGKMQIECSPVSLQELLDQVETMTRTQIRQKNLSFEVQKPQTHDEIVVYGNYQRLLQVLLNLMGNAIKFTNEGGITVSAEVIKKRIVVQDEELPGLVKVRVADTGIGVSLDKQDKLFQSFSQVDGSLTRQYGGTGLGLAISQKLVEAMGGVVNFYSMGEGLGSTVTFTVPLYQEPVMIAAD